MKYNVEASVSMFLYGDERVSKHTPLLVKSCWLGGINVSGIPQIDQIDPVPVASAGAKLYYRNESGRAFSKHPELNRSPIAGGNIADLLGIRVSVGAVARAVGDIQTDDCRIWRCLSAGRAGRLQSHGCHRRRSR